MAFKGNPDVVFGDINLSEERISGPPHNPGQGGWPTIRYFNKDTGLAGGSYVKKTDDPMCTELGNKEYLTDYIEDKANTSLCNTTDLSGCSVKQVTYIQKFEVKSKEEIQAQFDRLKGMENNSMKDELKRWILQRKKILQQLLISSSDSLSSEL